jgi:hypothetical protein
MILEPKHKNFTGPLKIKETVKKIFNISHHMAYQGLLNAITLRKF